jgi:hypothetical protein
LSSTLSSNFLNPKIFEIRLATVVFPHPIFPEIQMKNFCMILDIGESIK